MRISDPGEIDVETLSNDREKLEKLVADYSLLCHTVQQSPLPHAIFNKDSCLVGWNEGYRAINQEALANQAEKLEAGTLTYNEIVPVTASILLDGKEREEHLANCADLHTEGFNEWRDRYFGERGWYRVIKYALPDQSVAGVAFDINELKNREIELQKATEKAKNAHSRFSEAISILDEGFVIFDEEDRLVTCNDAFREQFGEGAKFIIEGHTYKDMTLNLAYEKIIPGVEGREEEFVSELIEKRRSEEGFTHTFRRHDGKWIRQRDKRTPSGQLVGVRTDITELKERELEIERTSRRLTETTEAMAQGIMVLENETVTMFNSKVVELLELDDDILFIGQTLETFIELQLERGCFGKKADGISYAWVHERLIETKGPYQAERTTRSGKSIRVDGVTNHNGDHILTFTDMSELKDRERQLKKTSNRLQRTIDAMAQGIIVFEENKVVMFNENALDILEVDERILFEGQTIYGFVDAQLEHGCFGSQEAGEAFITQHKKLLEAGKPYQTERRTISGKYLRVDGVPGENGNLIITFTDVTATKARQREFENTSRMFVETTAAMSQGMVIFGEETVEFFNDRAEEMLGLPEGMLFVGAYWRDLLAYQYDRGDYGTEEQGRDYMGLVENNIVSRSPYEMERRTSAGRILQVNGSPIGDTDWLITFTDITAIRDREDEVRKTSRLLQGTTDAMIQGLMVLGETNIDFVNPQAREMLGVPESVLSAGKPWRSLIKFQLDRGDYGEGEEAQAKHDHIIRHIETGDPHHIERKNHDGRDLRVDGAPIGVNGWIATYTDISDIKAREKRLEEAMHAAETAERAKSEFLANMSHEIRTPMNGVMGMAELLATTELDPKQRMFTDVIVKSGASLLTIINDILDFSKIDAGQMELDPAPFALAEAIEDVATLVSSKVAEKDLELIVRIDPTLPACLVGDVGRLRQIITNLLGNAVKFTEKGHVYVNVDGAVRETADGHFADLQFSVEDTGIGIPKEDCELVFQKFSQVDGSATRKHEGTGLGLSIASSLVELMEGKIGVTSEVGVGTTFWFTASLPVVEETVKLDPVTVEMEGARILIIDDNEVNRAILTEQMATWKFDSASAASGPEGLEVMRAAHMGNVSIDLVILDFQMPDMTGADVLEAIRKDETLKDTPVLMLSSVDSVQVTQRFNELGAEANLTKPTRSSLLLETIIQVISAKRASSANMLETIVGQQQEISSDIVTTPENMDKGLPQSHSQIEPIAAGGLEPPETMQQAVELSPAHETETTSQTVPVETEAHLPSPAGGASQVDLEANTLEIAPPHAGERLDILVAEDNEVNQIVVRQILEGTGASFEIYENGLLALEAFQKSPPRMVLMDVSMPEMNGKEATIAIRQFEEENGLSRTPIVGVTAHALKGDMESCIEVGMDDYLSKPVSPHRLVKKVTQWLQQAKDAENVA